MSHLVTAPDMLATAAAHVDEIASTLRAANAAAAGPTCNLLAAAGDEVSAATAALFSAYGREYQAVVKQAAAFHSEFHPDVGGRRQRLRTRRSGQCGPGIARAGHYQRTDPDAVGPCAVEPQRIQRGRRAAGDRAAGCGESDNGVDYGRHQ